MKWLRSIAVRVQVQGLLVAHTLRQYGICAVAIGEPFEANGYGFDLARSAIRPEVA
jgi:hypothetical protein